VDSRKTEAPTLDLAAPRGGWLERLFKLRLHGTTVKTELIAGLTTFITMAYHRLPIERLRLPKAHRG